MLPTCLMPRAAAAAAATDNAPRSMLWRCRRSWQTRASGSPDPPVHIPPLGSLSLTPLTTNSATLRRAFSFVSRVCVCVVTVCSVRVYVVCVSA